MPKRFEPEFIEIVKRLKDKESELESFILEKERTMRKKHEPDDVFTARQVEQINQIVREEIRRVMESQRTSRPDVREVPPSPSERISKEGRGRPASPGTRVKLAGTVDAELEKLFRKECQRRGMSVSRLLDTVIWHYFGKPKFSFETSDNSE